ncbi:hypothetical protein B0H14DRAFT_2980394 [Mycena olivaceomarginata]|nr:hypothetical protein B0H14DRAFT_2980394 [Mycena olivaceomarginata]
MSYTLDCAESVLQRLLEDPQRPIAIVSIQGGTGGHGGNGSWGGDGGVGAGPQVEFADNVIFNLPSGQNRGTARIREGLAQIGYGCAELFGSFFAFIIDLWPSIPMGVGSAVFFVMDPDGLDFEVPIWCTDYSTLHEIIKLWLRANASAALPLVEDGHYRMVSRDGSFIMPEKFAETVKPHLRLEMSILRLVEKQNETTGGITCPHCLCTGATRTGNTWLQCSNLACRRNYRVDEQNQDIEEIFIQQPVFRRVHIVLFDHSELEQFAKKVALYQQENAKLYEDNLKLVRMLAAANEENRGRDWFKITPYDDYVKEFTKNAQQIHKKVAAYQQENVKLYEENVKLCRDNSKVARTRPVLLLPTGTVN